MDSFRVVLFSVAIFSTILTASYLLNMYRKIFFGKLFSQYDKLRDVNRYAIVPMVFIAALTLFLGVYPDPMINPVIGYTEAIFSNTPDVSSLPIIKDINTKGISSTIDFKEQNERFVVDNNHRYVIYNLNVNDINNLEIK
jgi:NADH:ubiquinone oxidoreductase subunit 5 (subunit L)/multisubunit Na+/H+ antiporter MnhA subunit